MQSLAESSAIEDSLQWPGTESFLGLECADGPPLGSKHRLVVAEQTSFEKEQFSANGSHQVLHYIMKNKIYTIDVALERIASDGEELFFSDRGVDLRAKLLYASSDRKEVAHHPNKRPLSYKGKQLSSAESRAVGVGTGTGAAGVESVVSVSGRVRQQSTPVSSVVNLSLPGMRSDALDAFASFEPATTVRVEFSVAELSSHHHGSSFVIQFEAVDCQTQEPLTVVEPAYSEPMQVISKPDVLQKKRLKEAGKQQADKHTGAQRKRAPPKTQAIVTDIQTSVEDMRSKLDFIYTQMKDISNVSPASATCGKKRLCCERDPENADDTFKHHLLLALESLGKFPGCDRPQKVRRLANTMRAEETERLAELADAITMALAGSRCTTNPLNTSSSRLSLDFPCDDFNMLYPGFS